MQIRLSHNENMQSDSYKRKRTVYSAKRMKMHRNISIDVSLFKLFEFAAFYIDYAAYLMWRGHNCELSSRKLRVRAV